MYDTPVKIEARQILEESQELFDEMVNQLDSWNGFADEFRCFDMDELDDICCGMTFKAFLEKVLGNHFDFSDDYFCWNSDGIFSIEDRHQFYIDNVSSGELLDEIISNYNHIWFPQQFEYFYNLIVEIAKES